MNLDLSEQTLKSEIVYTGKFFKIRQHEVVLANGKKTTRQIAEHPGACACVVMNEKQEVLLVSQYRKAAEKVLVELPAGKLDPGETPEVCIKREIEEETGIAITKPVKLCEFYPSPGFTDEKMFVYLAHAASQGKSRQMEDEQIACSFVSFQKALNYIQTGQIEDAKSIIGLLLAHEHLKRGE